MFWYNSRVVTRKYKNEWFKIIEVERIIKELTWTVT